MTVDVDRWTDGLDRNPLAFSDHRWTPEILQRGACKDVPPVVFFPKDGPGVSVAKRVCDRCPVQAPCLEYALSLPDDLYGVWGGTSQAQRRRMRHERVTTPFPEAS